MWVRRLALTAAGLTLVLIVAGGLVTNTDSGLACPDWPTCFGSPMPKMVGGVAVEHTHRLIASAVGFLTALLVLLLWSRDGHKGLGWLATLGLTPLVLGGAFTAAAGVSKTGFLPAVPAALTVLGFAGLAALLVRARGATRLSMVALILVLAQGLLGGLTVVYKLPPTVLVLHLGTSMLFFSTLLLLGWGLALPQAASREPKAEPARGLLWLTTGALYLQILIGATVRHTGAGLICTDLPFCRGALWPTNVHPAVHLHMVHRALALIVAALIVAVAARLWNTADAWTRRLARGSTALVAVQIALGVLTIVTFKELLSVTGHLMVGAMLLGTFVSLLVRTRVASELEVGLAEANGEGREAKGELAGAQS
jgi:heme A synthase